MRNVVLQKDAIHTGSLILVNREYPYQCAKPADPIPLTQDAPQILLDRRAAVLLTELMQKIHGWSRIVPVSGWRSRTEQQDIFDGSLSQNGAEFTRKYVALPGHSEHETGLAIDLGLKREGDEMDWIRPFFSYDGICRVFRTYAADYGFVERYPAGKESVTGIGHEPWHFRYVGVPHAHIMQEKGLTLEEYLELLRDYPYGKRALHVQKDGLQAAVSYLRGDRGADVPLHLPSNLPTSISGDNIDGFILTEWRGRHG